MLKRIRASLKYKLISLLIAIIVVMVAMIGFFSYYDTSRTIRRDVAHFSEQILRQANLNLNRQYMEYERGLLVLGTSDEFLRWLQIDPADQFELISVYHSLERNYMRSFLVSHPEIISITLLSERGGEFHYSLSANFNMNYSLADEPWLSEVGRLEKVYLHVGESAAYVEDQYNINNNRMILSLVGQFGAADEQGFLKMDVSLESAQSSLNQMELGAEGIGLIAKPDGTVLIHQDKDKVGTVLEADIAEHFDALSGSFFRKKTGQLIIFDTIPYTGWKSVAFVSNHDITTSINRVRNVTVVIATLGMLIAIALVTVVAASITRRISLLRSHMKQVQFSNFSGPVQIEGTDEVSDLSRSFNRMLDQLDESIQQLTDTKLMQQRAVFSAMQSQIHSHFLYNALESINSMAYLAGHAEIERMSISLSRMLRYTSNYKDAIVRLEDEMTHVQHYMNICRIRFGENVSFRANVDKLCLDVQCPKVILQPIAENAIKHGVEKTGEPTQLEVTVQRSEDTVYVIFEDNGDRCDMQRLEEYRKRLQQGTQTQEDYTDLTNVGLLNVHYRLQAFYQTQEAGIEIEKGGRLGGVKVTVRIPGKLPS